MKRILLALLGMTLTAAALAGGPATFPEAKAISRAQVYHDQNQAGDLYCGCAWQWAGKSGGIVEPASCGYQTRAQPNRAARIEWEHLVPAATFGRQRQCWQSGGRDNCQATDPVFNVMEADLHNLAPVVGEVNADRSNFNVGMVAGAPHQYGQCPFKVDFQARAAEPPDSAKGLMARAHFYMADRYGLNFSQQQERVLIAWDRAFPPSAWEIERDRRISAIVGHGNPFVSARRTWTAGYRPTRDGLLAMPVARPSPIAVPSAIPAGAAVIGNRNSRIYHVRGRCPGYYSTSASNRVAFPTEAAAAAAGFRRARNCN